MAGAASEFPHGAVWAPQCAPEMGAVEESAQLPDPFFYRQFALQWVQLRHTRPMEPLLQFRRTVWCHGAEAGSAGVQFCLRRETFL